METSIIQTEALDSITLQFSYLQTSGTQQSLSACNKFLYRQTANVSPMDPGTIPSRIFQCTQILWWLPPMLWSLNFIKQLKIFSNKNVRALHLTSPKHHNKNLLSWYFWVLGNLHWYIFCSDWNKPSLDSEWELKFGEYLDLKGHQGTTYVMVYIDDIFTKLFTSLYEAQSKVQIHMLSEKLQMKFTEVLDHPQMSKTQALRFEGPFGMCTKQLKEGTKFLHKKIIFRSSERCDCKVHRRRGMKAIHASGNKQWRLVFINRRILGSVVMSAS